MALIISHSFICSSILVFIHSLHSVPNFVLQPEPLSPEPRIGWVCLQRQPVEERGKDDEGNRIEAMSSLRINHPLMQMR